MTDRAAVLELLKLEELIDIIIPRGGEGLIRFVVENSRIPVIKHYKGVCHVFIDESAELGMADRALPLTQRSSAPASVTQWRRLLVHKNIAGEFLPLIAKKYADAGVEIRGDEAVLKARARCSSGYGRGLGCRVS